MKPYVWTPARPRPYTQIKCGTNSGYTFHYSIGEKPCRACRKAHSAHNKTRRAMSRAQQKQHQFDSADPATRRLLEATAEAFGHTRTPVQQT